MGGCCQQKSRTLADLVALLERPIVQRHDLGIYAASLYTVHRVRLFALALLRLTARSTADGMRFLRDRGCARAARSCSPCRADDAVQLVVVGGRTWWHMRQQSFCAATRLSVTLVDFPEANPGVCVYRGLYSVQSVLPRGRVIDESRQAKAWGVSCSPSRN